jgi:hypothetical protein
LYSLALIVGQDKHALSLVDCANLTRAEYSERTFITQFFQITDDCGESQRKVSFDILEEAHPWLKKSNSVCDKWPEVARVVCAESFAGCAEWLARVSRNEDVHQSVKRFVWEGFKIVP